VGMVYGKKEIVDFANRFTGKIYSISREEKGDIDYGDIYTRYYSGKIENIPGI
jgi:hypothetical protein